jgi:hypothetical protein
LDRLGSNPVPRLARRAKAPPQLGRAPVVDGASRLTDGQANAVRAAFVAGVKPSTIARHFGISQAAVRGALAADARGRKR